MANDDTTTSELEFVVGHVSGSIDLMLRWLVSEKFMQCFRGEAGHRAAKLSKGEDGKKGKEKDRVEVGIVGGPGKTLRVYSIKKYREAVAKLTRQLNEPQSASELVEARRALDVSGVHLVDTENRIRLTREQVIRLGLTELIIRADDAELEAKQRREEEAKEQREAKEQKPSPALLKAQEDLAKARAEVAKAKGELAKAAGKAWMLGRGDHAEIVGFDEQAGREKAATKASEAAEAQLLASASGMAFAPGRPALLPPAQSGSEVAPLLEAFMRFLAQGGR